jgi:hypothetical protein
MTGSPGGGEKLYGSSIGLEAGAQSTGWEPLAKDGPGTPPPGGGAGERPASESLKEARQMTGSIHVADAQGDSTRTWDTADPATVQEIEEVFREAQAAGRLVYRQTGNGRGEQVTLDTWNPEEHTDLFVAPRLAGG